MFDLKEEQSQTSKLAAPKEEPKYNIDVVRPRLTLFGGSQPC